MAVLINAEVLINLELFANKDLKFSLKRRKVLFNFFEVVKNTNLGRKLIKKFF